MPSSDAEKVIREFFAYAVERRRDGVMDFAAIVEGFRRALQGDSSKDGAFSRKVLKIMREFLARIRSTRSGSSLRPKGAAQVLPLPTFRLMVSLLMSASSIDTMMQATAIKKMAW